MVCISKKTSFFSAVFLISSSVLAMQILQSRVFSVTTWYHLSFMVISIAMFGLTLGALKIYKGDEEQQRKNYARIASNATTFCGISLFLATWVQMYIPMVSENVLKTMFYFPIVAIFTTIPYYFAGVAISVSLTRAPYSLPKIYGIDLLGAALGCLVVMGIMELIDTPSGLVLVAALVIIAGIFYLNASDDELDKIKKRRVNLVIYTAVLLFIAFLNANAPRPFLFPLWSKTGYYIKRDWIDYEKWNSISRIVVTHEFKDRPPFLWGPSKKLPEDMRVPYKNLIIDGDASTPITPFDPNNMEEHIYLEYDITNLAYRLPHLKSAAIIGVGGGRDLLAAKYFGVERVTAMDINKVMVDLLNNHPKYTSYNRLRELKGVKIVHSEARSWFRQNIEKFDVIQMSLIDTWAATGAGAFALSENGLYTVNAWTVILNDLNENGVFTVSRWHKKDAINETARILSLAMGTLYELGIINPRNHIFLATSGRIATLIVSKTPLTSEQLGRLHQISDEMEFKVISSPMMAKATGVLENILRAKNMDDLITITKNEPYYDLTPPTDMRPFFFNQVRFSNPFYIVKLALSKDFGAHLGQAKATLNLFVIIVFSSIMVLLIIVLPLYKKMAQENISLLTAGTFYFLLIGLGFMLIEISLLQALGVFLGHPIYGLSVLLFSLILSTGLGSLLSEKIPLNTLKKQIIWSALAFFYVLVLAMNLESAFLNFAEVSLMQRAIISVVMIMPCGLLVGFGFPTGMALIEKIDSKATPWFWGINGAAGVMGSAIAIATNISLGLNTTLVLGGICYALLSLTFISFSVKTQS